MVVKNLAAALFAAVLMISLPLLADSDATSQVRSLFQESLRASQAYTAAMRAAETADARQALKAKDPKPLFAQKFVELAKKLGEDPAAGEALIYAVQRDADGPAGKEALELLARDHANSQRMEFLIGSYPHPSGPAAEKLFRAVAERNTNRIFQANAKLILAETFKDYSPNEAEKLFRELVEKYADINASTSTRPVAEQARRGLLYVQKLSVGKSAPEITAEDLNGKGFTDRSSG